MFIYIVAPLGSGPCISVSIATDYGLDGPGSNPSGDEIFCPPRPALWPTQPPVKWVPGFPPGGRGCRDMGLTLTPSSAEGPRKSRATPVLNLRACVTCKKGENLNPITEIKMVKCSRYRPGVAQRGRGIALLFNDRGTRRG